MMYHQPKIGCKRICRNSHILIIETPTVTFKLAHQPFSMTLHLIRMHHHTKCSYKRLRCCPDKIKTCGQIDTQTQKNTIYRPHNLVTAGRWGGGGEVCCGFIEIYYDCTIIT